MSATYSSIWYTIELKKYRPMPEIADNAVFLVSVDIINTSVTRNTIFTEQNSIFCSI